MALVLIGVLALIPWQKIKNMVAYGLGLSSVVLHTFVFFWLHATYYDTISWRVFFLQASQYKPFFFKSPVLEGVLFISMTSLVVLLWSYLHIEVEHAKKS